MHDDGKTQMERMTAEQGPLIIAPRGYDYCTPLIVLILHPIYSTPLLLHPSNKVIALLHTCHVSQQPLPSLQGIEADVMREHELDCVTP
jgi:hypothetical protein